MALRLAYSPCPNDTYIFHAWVSGLLDGAPAVEETLADIDRLNSLALSGEVDVAKVSFNALLHLRDRYSLLHAGGALGRGVGPLIVARKDSSLRPASSPDRSAALADEVSRVRVAIPGQLTTAALLLSLFIEGTGRTVVMPFDRIMPAVVAGEVEAGVIIHEGRFTFAGYGLRRLIDLGEWWEQTTGLPIPLGGIEVRRALGREVASAVEKAIRSSVERANRHPEETSAYVSSHAQEMDQKVCAEHIALYVNEFTLDYGEEGEAAIRELLSRADRTSPGRSVPSAKLFWDEE